MSGQRAPAFTKENAAAMGSMGGRASAEARRKKKAMRELAQMILDRKVTDDEINNRLRKLGILPEEKEGRKPKKATVGLAILGHMADLGMQHASEKEASASVKAGETLIRIAYGETQEEDETEGTVTGAVLLPAIDDTLGHDVDDLAESQTSEAKESGDGG